MNDNQYIEQVKATLSSAEDAAQKINKIFALQLPGDANPLVVLIHGDSQQLQDAVHYAKEYDPAQPDEEEIAELSNELSGVIIAKIERYIDDWDSENIYKYSFRIIARYGAFTNEHGDKEYIDITKNLPDVTTVSEAVAATKEWEERLLERVILYSGQETGLKQISVTAGYIIRDSQRSFVVSGTLNFGDERGISTWLNQGF